MSNGDSYPGEYSRKVDLTVACLLDEDEGELPQLTCLTKLGIVYELSLLRKAYYNIPWSQFYDWAKELCGGSIATFSSFKVLVGRLERKGLNFLKTRSTMNLSNIYFNPH